MALHGLRRSPGVREAPWAVVWGWYTVISSRGGAICSTRRYLRCKYSRPISRSMVYYSGLPRETEPIGWFGMHY